MPDDATESEIENAYRLAPELSLLNGGYRFNLKYDAARFFTERAAADGKNLSVCMNMLVYACRDPIRPYKTADGKPASVNPVFTDRSSVVSIMPKTRFIG